MGFFKALTTRPRKLALLAPVGVSYDETSVKSEAELHNVLTAIAARGSDGPLRATGGAIRLVGPMTFSAPVIITVPGLTIRASGRFPIMAASAAISTMFDVRAEMFCVRDLLVYADSSRYFTTFVTNSGNATSGRTANNCRLIDCDLFTDRVYVDSSAGDGDEALVQGCRQVAPNGTHSASVVFDSSQCRLIGSWLDDGGGDSVTIGSNGANCAISATDFDEGDATSTASAGNNTWTGNTRVTTLTLHADDEESANTP